MSSDLGSPLVLEARGLEKRFGSVHALKKANFSVGAGEVVALVGDNGAGKSTLVKILSGAIRPDDGEFYVNGKRVHLDTPADARALGIQTVYQDLAVAGDLDPIANLYLGRERVKRGLLRMFGWLDSSAMRAEGERLFNELGVTIPDSRTRVSNLSGGQRQGVAVSRAVAWATEVVIMDEPTAALGVVQTKNVLNLIRQVRARGVPVVLVSHSMPDVLAVADRIEVFRLGSRVARFSRQEATLEKLVAAMTGALRTEGEVE